MSEDEIKHLAERVVNDGAERALSKDVWEEVVMRRGALLITYDPDTDFKVQVIPHEKISAIEEWMVTP